MPPCQKHAKDCQEDRSLGGGEAGGARRVRRGDREEESCGERTVYVTDGTGKFQKEKAVLHVRICSQRKGDAAWKVSLLMACVEHEATLEARRWTRGVKLPPQSPDPRSSLL